MNFTKWSFLFFLSLLLISSPILAGQSFDGFYLGAYTGYVDSKDKGTEYDEFGLGESGWSNKLKPEGFNYGLNAGYNKSFSNNLVLGIETDYEARGNNQDKVSHEQFGTPSPNYFVQTKISQAASLRAKLGFSFENKLLVYITGGYARAKVKRDFIECCYSDYPDYIGTGESYTKWHDGWTVGLGADYMLTPAISANAQYRFTDFGRERMNVETFYATESQHLKEQSLRLGMAYHF
jgi:outer membrane immunogenic protein